MINKNKICYKVHHVGTEERSINVKNAERYFANHFYKLDVESVKISTDDDLKSFLKLNPKFYFSEEALETNAEIGVIASNYKAWEAFLESDYEYLILCEDDIVINEEYFLDLFFKCLEDLPDHSNGFAFGHLKKDKNYYNQKQHDIESNYLCDLFQKQWIICYVLNKDGAKLLYDAININGLTTGSDYYFFDYLYHSRYDVSRKSKEARAYHSIRPELNDPVKQPAFETIIHTGPKINRDIQMRRVDF